MLPEAIDGALIDRARRRLTDGGDLADAFVRLREDGVAPDDAVLAVCVAAGSTRDEAVTRYREFVGLWEGLEAAEEIMGLELLIGYGYFEADAVLDDQQQVGLAYLKAALGCLPSVPSGFAASLSTKLRTGRLVEAFHQMERLGARRWPENAGYWSAMRHANEILRPHHERKTSPS